jgi:putative Mg2+ transporter-C (MgtC) family protein
MRFVTTFHLWPFLDTLVSYLAAFVLGTLIGAERQYRQRNAGLRTNALVAIGAAAFVDLGQRLGGDVESIRIIAYVVSGIGFLGAGVIMKEGLNVRGLNTAATLWCSAAVGAIAGSDMLAEAVLLTGIVLLANTALRPLVDAINRIPVAGRSVEATYLVTLTTTEQQAQGLGDELVARLEAAQLPVGEVRIDPRAGGAADVVATLTSTIVDDAELDQVADALQALPGVRHVTWQGRTHD